MSTTDTNLLADITPPAPPAGADPNAPPAQPNVLDDPAVLLAIERAKNETLQQAFASRPQEDPIHGAAYVAPPPQAIPNSPLDLLDERQRAELAQQSITDPMGAMATMSQLASRLERMRFEQQAQPVITAQAQTFVDLFKSRMARDTAPNLYAQIEPLFNAALRGLDLRPLVPMDATARDNELLLRWNSAKGVILEKQIASARPPTAEPRLQTPGGPPGAPSSATPGDKFSRDPWLVQMKANYGFTDEQIKAIEETL